MAERSIAAVLKTVEGNTSGGSNPSLSANHSLPHLWWGIVIFGALSSSARTKAQKMTMKVSEANGKE